LDRLTLPKNHLLRTTGDFQRVYQTGRRFRGDGFAVIFLPNSLEYSRLGISVQKKAGNAVRRNRIKRLIREVFRLHRDLFPPVTDVVIAVRPGFAINSLLDMQINVARVIGVKQVEDNALA
jgi:ribonuclease P protein component